MKASKLLIYAFFLNLSYVSAQDGVWIDLQEPKLNEAGFLHYKALISSGHPELLSSVKQEITDLLKTGKLLPNDPNTVLLIKETVLLPSLQRSFPRVFNDPRFFITTRISWIELLSLLEAQEAQTIALAIIENEDDPDVLEAAYKVIRNTKKNPDPKIEQFYYKHLRQKRTTSPDEALSLEILRGIVENYGRGFEITEEDVFEAVYEVSQDTRLQRQTRTLAQNVLKLILGLE